MSGPEETSSDRPFAVGVDRHMNKETIFTSDPVFFEGVPSVEEARTRLAESQIQRLGDDNEYTNHHLCKILHQEGIPTVFAEDVTQVMRWIKDSNCKLLFFHAMLDSLGDSTKIFLKRLEELQVIFIYSGQLPVGLVDHAEQIAPGFYRMADATWAMLKPHGVVEGIRHLLEEVLEFPQDEA